MSPFLSSNCLFCLIYRQNTFLHANNQECKNIWIALFQWLPVPPAHWFPPTWGALLGSILPCFGAVTSWPLFLWMVIWKERDETREAIGNFLQMCKSSVSYICTGVLSLWHEAQRTDTWAYKLIIQWHIVMSDSSYCVHCTLITSTGTITGCQMYEELSVFSLLDAVQLSQEAFLHFI